MLRINSLMQFYVRINYDIINLLILIISSDVKVFIQNLVSFIKSFYKFYTDNKNEEKQQIMIFN